MTFQSEIPPNRADQLSDSTSVPFEQEAANLFFQLVSSRYEYSSLILTSNLPFARWGEVFGDQVVAAVMVDRIVHHAEVITLKGSSYRLKDSKVPLLIPPVREPTDAEDPTSRGQR